MSDGESPLIHALRQAVRSAPEQAEFRVALAEALIGAGDTQGAIVELGEALRLEPGSARARELMLAALSGGPAAKSETAVTGDADAATAVEVASGTGADASTDPDPDPDASKQEPGFDWSAAEAELGDIAPPPRFT
ncbi:tetratricopeptide repeat protein, partial [Catenulispora pinisilvae]|uniref:tetratricopeptide repeat protein n=2 Tax=Catenulispora pinisilvae TaxID=2705253 RepID=UPI0018922C0B